VSQRYDSSTSDEAQSGRRLKEGDTGHILSTRAQSRPDPKQESAGRHTVNSDVMIPTAYNVPNRKPRGKVSKGKIRDRSVSASSSEYDETRYVQREPSSVSKTVKSRQSETKTSGTMKTVSTGHGRALSAKRKKPVRRRRSHSPPSTSDSDDGVDDNAHRGRPAGKLCQRRKAFTDKHEERSRKVSEDGDSDLDDDRARKKRLASRHRYVKNMVPVVKPRNTKDIKPSRFDGRGCVETYLAQFAICATHNGWTEDEKLAHLKCSLADHAAQLLWDSGNPAEISYDDLVEKLRRRYGSLDQQEKFQAELRARRRHNGESLAELCQDIRRMMTRAYPGEGMSPICGQIAKEHFLTALDDRDMELKIREREPKDLESAFKHAIRLEALLRAVDGTVSANRDDSSRNRNRRPKEDQLTRRVAELERKTTTAAPDSGERIAIQQRDNEIRQLRGQLDEMNKEMGRLKALVTAREAVPPASIEGRLPPAPVPETPVRRDPPRQQDRRSVTCYNCNGQGHFSRDCTEPRRPREQAAQPQMVQPRQEPHLDASGTSGNTMRCDGVSSSTKSEVERKIYLQLYINGTLRKCLVDTGSDVTLLPSYAVEGVHIEACTQRLRAANGTSVGVKGRVIVQALMRDHRLLVSGLASDHIVEIILGNDFLQEHDALWNFRTGELILDGVKYKLCTGEPPRWCRRIVLQSDCSVPGRTEAVLPTKVMYNDLTTPIPARRQWITEARTMPCGLQISSAVLPEGDINIPVRVLNPSSHDIALKAGETISNLESVEVCESDQERTTAGDDEYDALFVEMVNRVDSSVLTESRKQLFHLLKEFKSAFSRGENDLGRTHLATHCIDTADSRPVRQALRRQTPAHMEAIRQHVRGMLDQGIIEPSRSPWASNIVLVRKKDQTLRCCIDYRQLNNVTRKDAYPLPRTDMCLDAMNGSSWFSTFDLRSSYHQVPMDPRDADKTAFICREGQFRFLTMPFGLCNAGATFQRLMDVVMSGLSFEVCLAYLDDVIVFAPTIQEQFVRLRLVLSRFQEAGLKLKPSKCCLLQTSVAFLGHVVSAGVVSVDPKKVEDISNWPTPTNLTEVRSFIGLCSYYRRFVKDFGAIAAPLNSLSGKNHAFVWDESCQKSFDALKQCLISAPTLAMPNDVDSFVLDTDASAWAIGAVLSQNQEGIEKPVAYASRKLSKQEMNYCVTKRELLAVVFFLKYFRHYLMGRRFQVRTDHAALQWLRRIPDPVGQQARWIGYMEEFDFTVVHRPGSRHGNADALSRKPCRNQSCHCITGDEADLNMDVHRTLVVRGVEPNGSYSSSANVHDTTSVRAVRGSETKGPLSSSTLDRDTTLSKVLFVPDTVQEAVGVHLEQSAGGISPPDLSSEWSTVDEDEFEEQDAEGVPLDPALKGVSATSCAVSRVTDETSCKGVAEELERGGAGRVMAEAASIGGPDRPQAVPNDASEQSASLSVEVIGVDGVRGEPVLKGTTPVTRAVSVVTPGVPTCTLENIAQEQEKDEDIRPVLAMRRSSDVKPTWDEAAPLSPVAKALWQQWEQLRVCNNILCRRFEYVDGRPAVLQAIVPYSLREEMFRAVHEGMTGGHMGRTRTEDQLQRRAYWPGWTSDVRHFLKRCQPCARYQRGGVPRITPLKPMVAGDVWERVSIDITGPHPRSRRGNIYLLTVVDHFSKWSDAFPLPNHNATTVARTLFDRVIAVFGPPLQLLSDRGAEFESSLMQEFCKWLGIQKLRTTAYKPSTNGIVERYHRSLNSILAKIIAEDQRDWCERVPVATAAYRASTHEVTGYSPNFLMFGRENRAPVDVLLGVDESSEDKDTSVDEFVESKRRLMREVYSRVRQQLGVAANKRKDYYDTKVKSTIFVVGTWVWYLYPRRRVGLSPKWQRHCTGPYLIVRVISPHNLAIQKTKRSKPFVVHRDKLKLFLGDAPPSWISTDPVVELRREDSEPTLLRNDSPLQLSSGEHVSAGSSPEHSKDTVTEDRVDEPSECPTRDCIREPPNGGISADGPGSNPSPVSRLLSSPSVVLSPNPSELCSKEASDFDRPKRVTRRPVTLANFVCAVFRESMEEEATQRWNQPRRCPVGGCGHLLARSDSLRRHLRRCHPAASGSMQTSPSVIADGDPIDPEETEPPQSTKQKTLPPSEKPLKSCRIPGCTFSALGPRSLNRHLRRHHASTIGDCGNRVSTKTRGTDRTSAPPVLETRQLSSSPSQAVTSERLIRAADAIIAAGPGLHAVAAVKLLVSSPHLLPEDVARGMVVAARVAACNVANLGLTLVRAKDVEKTTFARGSFASVSLWAREPGTDLSKIDVDTVGNTGRSELVDSETESSCSEGSPASRSSSAAAPRTRSAATSDVEEQALNLTTAAVEPTCPNEQKQSSPEHRSQPDSPLYPDLAEATIDELLNTSGVAAIMADLQSTPMCRPDEPVGLLAPSLATHQTADGNIKKNVNQEAKNAEDQTELKRLTEVVASLADQLQHKKMKKARKRARVETATEPTEDTPPTVTAVRDSPESDGEPSRRLLQPLPDPACHRANSREEKKDQRTDGLAAVRCHQRSDPSPSRGCRHAVTARREQNTRADESDAACSRRHRRESASPDRQGAASLRRGRTKQIAGRVVIHRSRREEKWAMAVAPSELVLVVGDSNLRPIAEVPENWVVHVFPGAKCRDVVELLQSMIVGRDFQLKRVLVQVGINHRNESTPVQDIADMRRVCRRLEIDFIYVGVPIPPNAPRWMIDGIRRLNEAAHTEVGNLYLPPLSTSRIVLARDDPYGIHHDAATVSAVVHTMIDFVAAIERQEEEDRSRGSQAHRR
jgi:transposase InsO family protein/predicted aspartyl protease